MKDLRSVGVHWCVRLYVCVHVCMCKAVWGVGNAMYDIDCV